MLRSRRFALIASIAAIGLAACGDAPNTTSSGGNPAVIHIGSAGSTGSATEGRGGATPAADKMMVPFNSFEFIVDGTLPDVASTATAWQLPAGQKPDMERIAKIAAVLGVKGEIRELPADQGGGWQIGSADYTGANLTVSADGMLSWWFNPDPAIYSNSSSGCAVPVEDTTGGGSSVSGSTGTDAAVPPETTPATTVTDPVPPDTVVCDAPEPPAGVPTKAEAEAKANDLLAATGYDVSQYELETYADEWSANVTAYLMLDGHRSPLTISMGFGAEGAVTWMSGSLATPQKAGDYPLVGTAAGLQRLTDGTWMGYYGAPGMLARNAVDVGVANDTVTAPSAGAPTADTAVAPPDTVLVDPTPVTVECNAAADCVPETFVPETITVHLNDVRVDLTMVWDVDGTVWLVPAYTFVSTDGGYYTVIAVDDQFVQLPEPAPAVTDPTVSTIDLEQATKVLVGVSESDAVAAGADLGWTVRVVTRDGESLAVTDDYRTDRVNVAVDAGKVTSVQSIG